MEKLAAALAKAQGQMSFAIKDAKNPHFGNKYADLASVWDAIRTPLSANGLSVTQATDVTEGGEMILITTLWHASGESISSRYPIAPVQRNPQGYGSALSYARRYALSSLVGVVQSDDDGNAASGAPAPDRSPAKASAPVAPPATPPATKSNKKASGSAAPVDAAQAWATQAARALQDMRSAADVDAWLNAAADKLARLQQVSPSLYDSIMTIATTTHDSLRHQDAAQ